MLKVGPLAALVALVVFVVPRAEVAAWGFTGHRFVTDRAIDALPPDLKPFFQKYRTFVVEHSVDPDTYRTIGWAEEPPRHFLDMDSYGPFPFRDLPHDYKDAVASRGERFVLRNGTLPWRTEEVYERLRTAFVRLKTDEFGRDNITLFTAVMAHYVADSFQPFHASANYDGQLTGQRGIHARFETELFDRYKDRLRVAAAPLEPVPNVREYMFATLTDSFKDVDGILAADREAIKGRSLYDDGYFHTLFEMSGPVLERRISGAVHGVASLIAQAWVDAGKPALPPEPPPRPPRPIRSGGAQPSVR